MLRVGSTLAVLSGGLLMAGCQSTAAKYAKLNSGIRVAEASHATLRAEQQIASGREALSSRNYAAAIAAFREASVEESFRPAALNGLGVAYAGIGREDLAEHFFRGAISLDPSNRKYDENLSRLYRTQLAAAQARRQRDEERQRLMAAQNRIKREREITPGVRVVAATQRIIRTNPGEVTIVTSPDKAPGDPAQVQLAVMAPHSGSSEIAPSARVAAVSVPGLRPGAAVAIAELVKSPAIVVVGHDVVSPRAPEDVKHSTIAITTTGRLHGKLAVPGTAGSTTPSSVQQTVQLAANTSIGQAIIGPLSVRESILGLGASETVVNEAR